MGVSLLTNAALAAFLGAMLAIVTVLTGVAWIGAGAGRGQSVQRNFAY